MTISAPDHRRVRDVFVRALDLPADRRVAFARRVLADRPDLAAEAATLLAGADDVEPGSVSEQDPLSGDRLWAEPLLARERLGDYRVFGLLGRGAMAVVLHAEHLPTGREVALKLLPPGTGSKPMRERLEREGRILRSLRHPSLARCRDTGLVETAEGLRPYLALDYFPGRPLLEWVRDAQPDRTRRLDVLARIADGVAHAHARGVVHRDLKPGNVLVDAHDRVCVLDFGVARILEPTAACDPTLTQHGQLIGTLRSMSPEQARGDSAAIGPATDVHALGLLVFEVLTGHRPYAVPANVGEALSAIVHAVPERPCRVDASLPVGIDRICAGALDRDPRERTPEAATVAQDLRTVRDGGRVPIRRGRWRRLRRRLRRPVAAAALLLTVAVLGVAVGVQHVAVDPAIEMQRARSAIQDADKRIHASERTEAGLRDAVALLHDARDRLDRAPNAPAGAEWQRFLQWRLGEAHYFLGAMTRDRTEYADALAAWELAGRFDPGRRGLDELDPSDAMTGHIRDINVARTRQGAGLALAALAAYREPRQMWSRSLRVRDEALALLASEQHGRPASAAELELGHRDLQQGYARNEVGESKIMLGSIDGDLDTVESGLGDLHFVQRHALLHRDPYARASLEFNLGRGHAIRAELTGDRDDLEAAEVWLTRSLEQRSPTRSLAAHVASQTWLMRVDRQRAQRAEDLEQARRWHERVLRRGKRLIDTLGDRLHPHDRGRVALVLAGLEIDAAMRGEGPCLWKAERWFTEAGVRLSRVDTPVDHAHLLYERARRERARLAVGRETPARAARQAERLFAALTDLVPPGQFPSLHARVHDERSWWSAQTTVRSDR